ncbi:4-(cytidine 5'-diphospho)-2-C-methyl-D-erythritol kinase [Acidovorax sp. GBBC 3334]|uniref:4-(cytidine 5'-diphospho)-2-C-methyl-D-erythritol kinase n=1 Tax=unclassified Acidovorax TaxID=2684926 RepID=UPI0023022262|nr:MULTISPECIES: 4-(cytidine 5'-diphospho)-2-C-methyl-D-erythritol kinase [unclassified Acidovorax]MDA8457099.1 4-(cytidine 5'-diphospho)-2-C-methyl-D-erythritol kinase [Acidovorax sp. GBBC 3334]MDA8522037.1 4-(cytidine 5'-diphospho)-2-C-methyl-D-erythritol kinase [Acidovorax sp. NCPPB 4044]
MRALYDLPAPAKLNLFLHITGRRPDGYHLLQSAFMLIDWCDTLHFELRQGGRISRDDVRWALPADDLCTRAARALQESTGTHQGVHITLEKSIPAQAGMGGGSSDAATTLIALNRLWALGLGQHELERIGLSLGADVPFFLRGHNAWVEGIGETLLPLAEDNALPDARFIVVKPEAGLDTKSIFSSSSLERNLDSATISGFAAAHYRFGRNVLQPVAEALCPEVSQAIQWLADKGLNARMTGSGSAVFAQMSHEIDLFDLPAKWRAKICDNLRLHPLAGWSADRDCG